jgi:hypothetical protein
MPCSSSPPPRPRPRRRPLRSPTSSRPSTASPGSARRRPRARAPRGPYLRQGDLSTVHGGEWAAANPPEVSPATGCGNKAIDVHFNLFFTKKDALAPSASTDLPREDCPDGPTSGLDWDRGEAPSLGDVTTTTSQTRFLKARSFTVRGTKSWHASVQPPSWEVTFTMRKKAHR